MADERVAADEGFKFAGQLRGTLAEAREHARRAREQLEQPKS
jgi:hypothetical protein